MTVRGGVERVVATWANYWVKQGRNTTIVTLLQQSSSENKFELDKSIAQFHLGVPQHRSKSRVLRALKMPLAAFRLYLLLKREKPDFLIANGIGLSVISAFVGLGMPQVKIVVCDHNNFESFPLHWRVLRYISYRFTHSVVSLTKLSLKKYQRIGSQAVHIPNPLGIAPQRTASLSQKQVLAIGRLTHQKGFDVLIDIWSLVSPKFPDWRLHIVGDGPERDDLISRVRRLKLSDSVEFVPATSDIEKHYLSSSIFVLTSRHEGLPVVLIEANAFGLPVISFDCPTGPSDFIQHDTGYLVPLGDTRTFSELLAGLMGNKHEREDMSRNALIYVQNYSTNKVMKNWDDFILQSESR